MKIRAQQKNSRQSPRKVRLVANQVKNLSLAEAFSQLALMERKASLVILKVMRQAVANAVHNHQLSVDDLEIDNILVKTGPTYKRWQPVSRGRAHKILKRTTHVEVILKTKGIDKKQNKRASVIPEKKLSTVDQVKSKKEKATPNKAESSLKKISDKKKVEKQVVAKKQPSRKSKEVVKTLAKTDDKTLNRRSVDKSRATKRRTQQLGSGK